MSPDQRALALYNELSGKAWVYAEELDVDILATENGVSYFLEWVQTRFMEVEVTKVSSMMTDLFKQCKRKPEQSVREFNVEFERLVLRLHEVQCELPPLIKAWLYLDKLHLPEQEELSLLSSVNNQFDVKKLQQAALIQDRSTRRPGGGNFGGNSWKRPDKWQRHSVHMTEAVDESSEGDSQAAEEDELVAEDVAAAAHSAYMTYQNAKAKYRETVRGRGADMEEIRKRSEERLKLAKQRSYCSACKRKGHWRKDPECPLRGRSSGSGGDRDKSNDVQMTVHSAQMCSVVHECYVTDSQETMVPDFVKGNLLAIVDTACTKTVAGHSWFEACCDMADTLGFATTTYDHEEFFKFGASRVYTSTFGVLAWFSVCRQWFLVEVAIVPCAAPLLLSRPVLGALGMTYDLEKQEVNLRALHLENIALYTSPTGHPALLVNDYDGKKPPLVTGDNTGEVYVPDIEAYMAAQSSALQPLFYPKVLPKEIENMLSAHQPLGGAGFFCWRRTAKQSRDFWIETEMEYIRIHVVPRRTLFNPTSWNTRLLGLKDVFLKRLDGHRTTEALPCLSEGTEVITKVEESFESEEKFMICPWIGRSRFSKFKPHVTRLTIAAPTSDARSSPIAMEHEEAGAVDRAQRPRGPRALDMDRAGIEVHLGGAARAGEAQRGGPHEGAAGGGCQEGEHHHPGQADEGPDDALAARVPPHTGNNSGAIWRLPGLGSAREQEQSQCPRRSGALGVMGRAGGGPEECHEGLCEEARFGTRSRSPRCGTTAVGGEFIRDLMVQGEQGHTRTSHEKGCRDPCAHGHCRGRERVPRGAHSASGGTTVSPQEEASLNSEEVTGEDEQRHRRHGGRDQIHPDLKYVMMLDDDEEDSSEYEPGPSTSI